MKVTYIVVGLCLAASTSSFAANCPPDSVPVGPICIDKYEASVWQIPLTNPQGKLNDGRIKKAKEGKTTLADLVAAGAIQFGTGYSEGANNYPCAATGNDCDGLYAVSIAEVLPARSITWFQAQQACANVGKRLLRNGEWQQAAGGTPDPGTDNGTTECNVGSVFSVVNTGSRSSCVSRWGAFDMVGNVWEWVEDWKAPDLVCNSPIFPETGDQNCFSGATTAYGPAAVIRGGQYVNGELAGVFAINSGRAASDFNDDIGFRCGR